MLQAIIIQIFCNDFTKYRHGILNKYFLNLKSQNPNEIDLKDKDFLQA